MEKTYKGWQDWDFKSAQREYTEKTALLSPDGKLQAAGWARRNVFDYDRNAVAKKPRRKEWDFYQLSNGVYTVQISFANITLGGYASASLIDLSTGKAIAEQMGLFLGGGDKYVLPKRGDAPNTVDFTVSGARFLSETGETSRRLYFQKGDMTCEFTMDIAPGLENITTVLPFDGFPDRYFMTTKQNCMPCRGTVRAGGKTYEFSDSDTFCVLDWGRVCTPYRLVWYWGNGSAYIDGPDGGKHVFGFEITWGIGSERNATETCIFYDGKAHKFGAVDVEVFPKPDGYLKDWHFISEDGRFDMTMKPVCDHHSDLNVLVMRMHSHQVHGLWSGKAVLDDGTVLEIRDMYAFCEYVENRW
ncbi:MAG: DUF2804 domain-containing protein [Clostridia bacterium]|nr:DUF2804 domain-containing protein [Clostridia bacterium]